MDGRGVEFSDAKQVEISRRLIQRGALAENSRGVGAKRTTPGWKRKHQHPGRVPESYEGQDNHSAMRSSSARGRCLPPFQGVIVFAAFPGVFAALDTPAILCQAFGLSALARGSQTWSQTRAPESVDSRCVCAL